MLKLERFTRTLAKEEGRIIKSNVEGKGTSINKPNCSHNTAVTATIQ